VQDDRLLHPGPGLRQPAQHGEGFVDRLQRFSLPAQVIEHQGKAHPRLGGQSGQLVPLGQRHCAAQVPGRAGGVMQLADRQPERPTGDDLLFRVG